MVINDKNDKFKQYQYFYLIFHSESTDRTSVSKAPIKPN